jgi:predicted permease
MRTIDRLRSWIRSVVYRRRVDRELEAELRFHLDQQIAECLAEGMTLADARAAAQRTFGSVTFTKEAARESLGLRLFDELTQDLRHTLRSLRKNPALAAVAIVTLALGIGANTAIFTVLDGVMFKPLPLLRADELVTFYENGPEGSADPSGGTGRFLRFSYPRFERLEQSLGSSGTMAAATRSSQFAVRVPQDDRLHFVRAQLVSNRFFETMAVAPAQGRLLTADDVRGEQPVAVVSDGFWRRILNGSSNVVGRSLTVNGLPVTVVGVGAPGFVGMWTDAEAELWLPVTLQRSLHYANNSSSYGPADSTASWLGQDAVAWLTLVARIPAAHRAQAVPLLQAVNHAGVVALADTFTTPSARDTMLAHTLVVEPFARGFSTLRSRFSDALLLLTLLVSLVLLVTCANIANLLLARAAGQARELGTRISLGASRARIIRQHLTESFALAMLGGAAGWVAGRWASALLVRQVLATSGPLPAVFTTDSRVLAFTIGASLLTAVVVGLAPALRAAQMGRMTVLGTNQRPIETATRLMRSLVIGQLAFSIFLVFAALLLGRTLLNIMRIDPGFARDRFVYASFDPMTSGYPPADMPALSRRLLTALEGLPGVSSVSVSRCGLIAGCASSSGFRLEGTEEGGNTLYENWVTPAYFATTGIPLVGGRTFDERDHETAAAVAIINRTVADRYFAGQNPVGRRLGFSQLDTEIVGVVGDARTQTLHEEPVPMVYFPIGQKKVALGNAALTNLDVRVSGDAAQAVGAIRDAIRKSEPALLVNEVSVMERRIERDLSRERVVAYLAFSFGALTLLLASLGLYGVLSYGVMRRTAEIGVRMALGAQRGQVVRWVIGESARLMAVGSAAGLIATALGARYLSGLLFGVMPLDSISLVAVMITFAVVMTLASYLPARRAVRIDPIRALRQE